MASPQTWKQIAAAVREVRDLEYEIAVDFQGAIRSAMIARVSGADAIYGFAQPRETPARTLYTRQVAARGTHIIEQNLSLAEEVAGRALTTPEAIFPRDETADQECERRLREGGIGQFALLNPGAGWGAKRWPVEHYGKLPSELAKLGLKPLINFGPGEEDLAQVVQKASDGTAEPICFFAHAVNCADPPSFFVHRRRHWPHAFGSGHGRSGCSDLWPHGSRAQRAIWNNEHRAAQPFQPDQPQTPPTTGRRPTGNYCRPGDRRRPPTTGEFSWLSQNLPGQRSPAAYASRSASHLRFCISGWRSPR